MSLRLSTDTHALDSGQQPAPSLWQSIRHLWCRHRTTITTPKTASMPTHVTCTACGWREAVLAAAPQGTRTWDSSRDETRFQIEKRRRAALEEQRQMAMARFAAPEEPRPRARRARRGTLLHMTPAVGE